MTRCIFVFNGGVVIPCSAFAVWLRNVITRGFFFSEEYDCGLLYEITKCNRIVIATIINSDLDSLVEWGKVNRTNSEPDKASHTVISRKKQPYDPNDYCPGIKVVVALLWLNWMKQNLSKTCRIRL